MRKVLSKSKRMSPGVHRILARVDPIGLGACGHPRPYLFEAEKICSHLIIWGGPKPTPRFVRDVVGIVFKMSFGIGYAYEHDRDGNGTRMKLHKMSYLVPATPIRKAAEEIAELWNTSGDEAKESKRKPRRRKS